MAKTTDKGQNKNNDVINKKEEPAKEASLKAAADDIKNLEQEMQDIEDKAQSLRAQEETAAQQDNQKQQTEEKEQPKDEQKAAETAEPVNTYSDSRVDYDPYYDQAKQISDLNQKIIKKYNLDYSPHIHVDAVLGWVWLFFKNYDFRKNPLNFGKESLNGCTAC